MPEDADLSAVQSRLSEGVLTISVGKIQKAEELDEVIALLALVDSCGSRARMGTDASCPAPQPVSPSMLAECVCVCVARGGEGWGGVFEAENDCHVHHHRGTERGRYSVPLRCLHVQQGVQACHVMLTVSLRQHTNLCEKI